MLIMVGSVLVLVSGFQTVSALRTLETREALETLLKTVPWSSTGLDVEGLIGIRHVAALVAAASAAICAILGGFILRKDRSARLGVSVAAVPMLLASLLLDNPLVAMFVVVAAAMLWASPSRDWFDGTWRPEPLRQPLPPPPAWPPPRAAHLPPPPPGSVPLHGLAGPALAQTASRVARGPRPSAVTTACALTWIFAGLTLLGSLGFLLSTLGDTTVLLKQLHEQYPAFEEQGWSDAQILSTSRWVVAVVMVWSLGGIVCAAFAFAGHRWAHLGLLISAGAAGCALAAVVFSGMLQLLVPLFAAYFVTTRMLRPEVRAWFGRPS